MIDANTTQIAAAGSANELAVFTFMKPFKYMRDGEEVDIHGVEMRALEVPDLALLDQFQGKPVALIQEMVARLCGIGVEQVQQLNIEDFGMLAQEVVWQVSDACEGMGLPFQLFAQPAEMVAADGLMP